MREREMLEKTFLQAPVGIALVEKATGRIDWANPALCAIFGYGGGELTGRAFSELAAPEDVETLNAKVLPLRQERFDPVTLEARYLKKDGITVWIRATISPFNGDGGHDGLNLAVITDITQSKNASRVLEAANREMERLRNALLLNTRRFKDMIDNAQIAIAIQREGKLLYTNGRFLEMFALPPATLVTGRSVFELIAPEKRDEVLAFGRGFDLGEVKLKELETIGIRADGSAFPFWIGLSPVNLEDGPAAIGFLKDIAERKRAEETLREQEAMYRDHFQNANDVFYTTTTDGVFTSFNGAFTTVLGYTREELVGKSIRDVLDPGQLEKALSMLAQKVERKIPQTRYELIVRHKDGHGVPMEISTRLVLRGGVPAGIHGIARDITERKRAEQALIREKENALNANRMKDKFVALLSHDIRSPLGAAISGMEALNAGTFGPLRPDQQVLLEKMIRSHRLLLKTADEALSVARLSSGNLALTPFFTEVRRMVDETLRVHAPAADAKGISLVNDFPAGIRYYLDPFLIGQVLGNLISNAIKFSKQGGAVTIHKPSYLPAAVAVGDHGVGLPPNTADLFKHDVRTTTAGTGGEKGSGMGLPLGNDIMAAHGGKILVDSVAGGGAEFILDFPVHSPTVLVVEDDPVLRDTIGFHLQKSGVTVHLAGNGQEGLDLFIKERPHLVISDLLMPEMDGPEMIKRIREDESGGRVKTIVLTAMNDWQPARQDLLQCGVEHFFLKPVNFESLQSVVHAALYA